MSLLQPEFAPNPDEVATIVAAGYRYEHWESVFIQHRWNDAYSWFRFSTAEVENLSGKPSFDWRTLRLKPPDPVSIYLGGELAVTGLITSRQAAFEGANHATLFEGRGLTWPAATSSILDKSNDYSGMTFEQIARRVMAPTGVGVKTIGKLNALPFEREHANVGETIWVFLERLARVRGIVLGSDHLGNMLLIDEHNYSVSAELVEGRNILKAQVTISKEFARHVYLVRGSTSGTDGHSGPPIAEQEATAPGSWPTYRPLLIPSEEPVWTVDELAERAKNESIWNEGAIINAVITVQGWKPVPGGPLWQTGAKVHVLSPMSMLDMDLKIQTATFTQNRQSGTLTTLELVAPWLLKDSYSYGVGQTPNPPPGDAKQTADPGMPATSPPAAPVPAAPPVTLPPK